MSTAEEGAPAPSSTPTPAPSRRVPIWAWIACGVVVIGAGIGIAIAVNSNAASPFEAALTDCKVPESSWARIGDSGNTLIIDGEGKKGDDGLSLEKAVCVMNSLDVPDSTLAKMSGTRALDGTQSDKFGEITVEWSYHPDNGLDLIFTR